MRCLVTGVAGFIGSTLCERLLKEGHSVVGIDCFTDYYSVKVKRENLRVAHEFQSFSLVEADLVKADLEKLLDGVQVIYHQAAQAGVRASWGETFASYCHHNILATQRLLEASKASRSLSKLVFASSSSVYGNAEAFPTVENVNPKPVSPYGVTKLAAENLVTLYALEFGVPSVSLRYFTVFGPRQRPDMAFYRFIRSALLGEKIVVYGDGEQTRDFTFITDAVDANRLAADYQANGEVFNIGGGTHASVNDVLQIISGYVGKLHVENLERVPGDARHTSADTSLAKQKLGFKPKISLQEGIRTEIEWLEAHLKK